MPRNGSGTYSLPAGNPIAANSVSNSTTRNSTFNDLATAITNSMARNGEGVPTADIPFGTNKITGLKDATGLADAANLKVIQNRIGVYCGTVGGTVDVITLTPSPAITAYVAGQRFSFIAGGANTVTGVTVNISGLGAKTITKRGASALAVGDIANNAIISIEYDGTQFQLLSPAGATALGSMATQDHTAVNIDGGTIDGVTIVGGSITGMTDIAIADGGTGASSASAAFTALKQTATEGSSGVAEVATDAETETGTADDKMITPAKVGEHLQVPKCQVTAGITGNILGDDDINITGVNDDAVGGITVTWAIDFEDAFYICLLCCVDVNGTYTNMLTQLAGTMSGQHVRETLTSNDPTSWHFVAWGKQV